MSIKKARRMRAKIARRDGSCCCYCGWFLPTQGTIEHYVPKSLGGSDHFDNLKIACKPCNQKRGNNPVPPPLKKPSSFPQGNSSFPAPQKHRNSSLNNSGNGANRSDNLKIACKPCNQKRGNNPVSPPLKKPSSFPQGNSSFPAPQKHRSSSLNNSGK